ncbi:hypothetical protein CP967_30630 [Streptomyces nitrosporeus]|uniref:Uncharacterized protein n=1 Tax=Streptomyces nitrosporeus TaxID=28894 RepID=A0A5J6FLA4_9ACTN|nr:hypothetical protein [Streptomyces nitrosporeus]QEU75755.1 hypothetical protein CP967_30630 [Streptomyces nitrosporeus]GGY87822.1 hypothetical protein GCM10010327_18120 [Streptomyces nitrosporeus]
MSPGGTTRIRGRVVLPGHIDGRGRAVAREPPPVPPSFIAVASTARHQAGGCERREHGESGDSAAYALVGVRQE